MDTIETIGKLKELHNTNAEKISDTGKATDSTGKLISAVKKAIDKWKIPRKQAIASVERILAMKEKL